MALTLNEKKSDKNRKRGRYDEKRRKEKKVYDGMYIVQVSEERTSLGGQIDASEWN